MSFGANLQYLRRMHGGMTQEKLAERMGVSRQTVSKWEADEAYPEVGKLIELCGVFSCKLDALLREDMAARHDAYSDIRLETVKAFRMARYVVISPNPEDDVSACMDAWARRSGLDGFPGYAGERIGWDFPFVSAEQKNRFGLRGYALACILPDGFEPACGGAEIARQDAAAYAVISIRDPFKAAFERIPHAYKLLLDYLNGSGFKENTSDTVLPCFERVYRRDGLEYMDVYVHANGVGRANLFTSLG